MLAVLQMTSLREELLSQRKTSSLRKSVTPREDDETDKSANMSSKESPRQNVLYESLPTVGCMQRELVDDLVERHKEVVRIAGRHCKGGHNMHTHSQLTSMPTIWCHVHPTAAMVG